MTASNDYCIRPNTTPHHAGKVKRDFRAPEHGKLFHHLKTLMAREGYDPCKKLRVSVTRWLGARLEPCDQALAMQIDGPPGLPLAGASPQGGTC